jgi:hypothetical protein
LMFFLFWYFPSILLNTVADKKVHCGGGRFYGL